MRYGNGHHRLSIRGSYIGNCPIQSILETACCSDYDFLVDRHLDWHGALGET